MTFKTQYGSVVGTDVLPPLASQNGKKTGAIRTHSSVAALCLLHARARMVIGPLYGRTYKRAAQRHN